MEKAWQSANIKFKEFIECTSVKQVYLRDEWCVQDERAEQDLRGSEKILELRRCKKAEVAVVFGTIM